MWCECIPMWYRYSIYGSSLKDEICELEDLTFEMTGHELFTIMSQITSSVKYCHDNGIIFYQILSYDNFFCVGDSILNLKILPQFYIDHVLYNGKNKKSKFKTLQKKDKKTLFTSPQVLTGNKHTIESDYWSIGVILYMLFGGHQVTPFWSDDDNQNV